jgi:hypothetical protein
MLKSHHAMAFYFARDHRQKYRFFSADPERELNVGASRTKKIWELAKKKLLRLPQRTLRQEQAFIKALKLDAESVSIVHSGCHSEKRLRFRFSLFLNKQRSKHIILLVGESLVLPVSGLAALLPGPNIFFYALALLMITQWQALRGINRLARKKFDFRADASFLEWEKAVSEAREDRYDAILRQIEAEHGLSQLNKILWK